MLWTIATVKNSSKITTKLSGDKKTGTKQKNFKSPLQRLVSWLTSPRLPNYIPSLCNYRSPSKKLKGENGCIEAISPEQSSQNLDRYESTPNHSPK